MSVMLRIYLSYQKNPLIEKIMKIELNKNQFKTLLTTLYCGEWLLNSPKLEVDKMAKDTDRLEQKIFSFAKEAGLENWVEYDEELEKYFPTEKMEMDLHGYIDKFIKNKTNTPSLPPTYP